MTYLYICNKCKLNIQIEKSIKEASKVEKCPSCKKELQRVYSVSSIKTNDGIK